MRKRILTVIFAVLLIIGGLTACKKEDESTSIESGEKKIKIITTIFPQYDFIREIAGDKVEVSMLLKPGIETHSYEPSPQDIIRIQESDLFIHVGGENDTWINEIFEAAGGKAPRKIELLDLVEAVVEEIVEGMEHDHDHEDGHAHEDEHEHEDEHAHEDEHEHEDEHAHEDEHEYEEDHEHETAHANEEDPHEERELDEHVWTSVKNAIIIVEALTNELVTLDAPNKNWYEANSTRYIKELESLDKAFEDAVAEGVRNTLVFGDRFPFRYMADAYGLEYSAAFPGCATDTEASAATIAFLIDKVRAENIPAVFTIELSNGKIAEAIAEATGAEVMKLHSAHNVTKDEAESGITYLEIMRNNVNILKEALQ